MLGRRFRILVSHGFDDWPWIKERPNFRKLPIHDPESVADGNHAEARLEVEHRRHLLTIDNVPMDANILYFRKNAVKELLHSLGACEFG